MNESCISKPSKFKPGYNVKKKKSIHIDHVAYGWPDNINDENFIFKVESLSIDNGKRCFTTKYIHGKHVDTCFFLEDDFEYVDEEYKTVTVNNLINDKCCNDILVKFIKKFNPHEIHEFVPIDQALEFEEEVGQSGWLVKNGYVKEEFHKINVEIKEKY
jgi:hypothetical protein